MPFSLHFSCRNANITDLDKRKSPIFRELALTRACDMLDYSYKH